MPEEFFQAYLACAEWAASDGTAEWASAYFAPETLAEMRLDCEAFYAGFADLIDGNDRQAGHDFWLTRCGHGAGFWDGDWPEPAATLLTNACKAIGNVDLYIGDDGMIHS